MSKTVIYLLPVKEVIKSLQLLFGFWHITSRSPATASLLKVHNLKTDSFSCRHKRQVNYLSALKIQALIIFIQVYPQCNNLLPTSMHPEP